MLALRLSKKISRSLLSHTPTRISSTLSLTTLRSLSSLLSPSSHRASAAAHGNDASSLLRSPWFAIQNRGVKVNAISVKSGNVIERTGRLYQVVESGHRQRGRGGAMIQMELRDVDSGNKVSLRFGPEESVEKIFVEEKYFTCLYTENNTVFLIEPETYEQLEAPLEVFGKTAPFLKEEMRVKMQLVDGRPLSGSVPKHVTCTIKDTQAAMKGISITPRYKKALLDNGLTVQIPSYLDNGEEIVINTEDNSFIGRNNK